jgi:hypothetical protein
MCAFLSTIKNLRPAAYDQHGPIFAEKMFSPKNAAKAILPPDGNVIPLRNLSFRVSGHTGV